MHSILFRLIKTREFSAHASKTLSHVRIIISSMFHNQRWSSSGNQRNSSDLCRLTADDVDLMGGFTQHSNCDNFSVISSFSLCCYKLTEKLIVVNWELSCKFLFDKSFLLEFNIHLHLQYFSFLSSRLSWVNFFFMFLLQAACEY